MPFAALLIGAILVVVAFNNSYPALVSELEADIPGYFKWAAAIAAILALGYIPGMRTPSRYLLGLVLLVILLKNYTNIYAGFTAFATSGGATSGGQGAANPTAAYTAAYAPAASGGASTSATTTASSSAGTTSPTQVASAASLIAANPLSPSSYLSALGASGFGGNV